MKTILIYVFLWLSFATFAVDPYLGYLYPAGMKKGTKTQIIIGGQALRGKMRPLITPDGIKILSVTSVPNFPRATGTQSKYLLSYLKNITEGKNEAPPLPEEEKREGWRKNTWWEKMDTLDELSLSILAKDLCVRKNVLQSTPSLQQLLILELEIAEDAKTGEYQIRMFGRNGVSNSKRFFVDNAEHFTEPLFTPPFVKEKPLPVIDVFPVVLDGQILPGETDKFVFKLAAGQDYTFSLCGRELQPFIGDAVPGHFQAIMRIIDAAGVEKTFVDDEYHRADPVLRFKPKNDGNYTLEVRDNIFRGRDDFVYRVVVTAQIEPYMPRKSLIAIDEAARSLTEEEAQKQILTAKSVVDITGVISPKGKIATFRLQAEKDDEIVLEVFARRFDSPLDSRLCLRKPDGTILTENDDGAFDLNIGTIAQNVDSYLKVKIPTAGIYTIELSDRVNSGDANYKYRLQIRPPSPDCKVYSAKSNINLSGNGTPILFFVERIDGFAGAVKLSCDDLDIVGSDEIAAAHKSGTIKFKQNWSRRSTPQGIEIFAEFNINGRVVKKTVIPADEVMQAFAYMHLVPASNFYAMEVWQKQNMKRQSLKTKTK